MRIVVLALFILSSCNPSKVENQIVVVHDTVYAARAVNCDSLLTANDSIDKALFKAAFAIERVRYYMACVDRKPSNIKYLKGWVKRAIE